MTDTAKDPKPSAPHTHSDPDVRQRNGTVSGETNGHSTSDSSIEPASAPTTPPGGGRAGAAAAEAPKTDSKVGAGAYGAVGVGAGAGGGGAQQANGVHGVKSMPGSRRQSKYADGTFGLEKLSLSVADGQKGWSTQEGEDEDVDAEGARTSVRYLNMNDDEPFPSVPKKENRRLSAASAALDLAPLSQTPPRSQTQRPFDTSIKTSDWPAFPPANHPTRGVTSPLASQQAGGADATGPVSAAPDLAGLYGSRKASPTGMADSIASLPAMPSKSVPQTPYGLQGGMPRTGKPNTAGADGFSQANRGFSNPDLARAFGKVGGGFSINEAAKPYGSDPIYGNMFSPVSTNPLPPTAAVAQAFQPQGAAYDPYGFSEDDGYGSGALYHGGLPGIKNKRADHDREFNRFSGVRIEDLSGQLLDLCKDQHGCRYLQKKLEEGDAAHRDMIYRETYGHFPELMTDPFGNYLCQKLLEYSTDEQRESIIESVANDLVGISLNMHGTRAVQKMVDFLANSRQPKMIRTLIYALSMNVVALIKDLNGNHVIQKCLNKLIPEDNQFIYNAIAANLIEVATHRHGCCVLQRSIDHASASQRVQLVTEIIFNSLYLVQDPFGNYVIQYILDLNDARFSEPLIRTFIGNVCSLSVQKFSSNVVEKCIRVADTEVRKGLVAEVLNRSRLEKLLRDSYGNYVIQTILDYCDTQQRVMLIELIRPILPSIRNTPYGKRIQSKLAREDASFSYGGGGGGGGGYGGRGRGYDRGGPQNAYHRHIGRPQLQNINALTEVYGTPGGGPQYLPPGVGVGGYMPAPPHAHAHSGAGYAGPGVREMAHAHSGMSYHAPGPDGQPWLHLRGAQGQPAGMWGMGGEGEVPPQSTGSGSDVGLGGQGHEGMPMWTGMENGHGQGAAHGQGHGHGYGMYQQANHGAGQVMM